ncbi:MAG: class I SAM-dependent methyltransferase [Actinomycetota bacterium]
MTAPDPDHADLLEAVHRGDVVEVARRRLDDGEDDDILVRIAACGDRIAATLAAEARKVAELLAAAGIEAEVRAPSRAPQRHALTVSVADATAAHRGADTLAAAGFERWDVWSGGAARSFDRNADHLTVGRTRGHTLTVRLSWRAVRDRRPLARAMRPTHGDWAMVSLPGWLWWAYPCVRVMRLAAERLGLRDRHAGSLGPFLATPDEMIEPLLDVAELGPDDHVVDLGCGDGRIPVAAALAGCRATGIELSSELAARARDRATDTGVADRVDIIHGDARDADLGAADVVIAFLPTDVLSVLLPEILASLPEGGRLVAHEQNRLPDTVAPRPDHSTIVVAEGAITVAQRWDAPRHEARWGAAPGPEAAT